jgi:hypothetical protein
LLTVNHPEYPSGHAFLSTALTEAVAEFFGTDDVEWTIVTSKDAVPQLVQTKRTYRASTRSWTMSMTLGSGQACTTGTRWTRALRSAARSPGT